MSMLSRTLRQSLVAFVATGLLGACQSRGAYGPSTAVTPSVEREVYEALLRDAYTSPASEVVVLNPELDIWEGDFGERPRVIPQDAWSAFVAAHAAAAGGLRRDLDPGLPVAWFTERDFGALPAGEGGSQWGAFRKRFPKGTGWITLSPIGFSRDGRTAVVAGSVATAALSASNDYFVLRRTRSGWRLWRKANISIA